MHTKPTAHSNQLLKNTNLDNTANHGLQYHVVFLVVVFVPFTFEAVTEDVLQDGNKVKELRGRIIYCFRAGAVQQSLYRKPAPRK